MMYVLTGLFSNRWNIDIRFLELNLMHDDSGTLPTMFNGLYFLLHIHVLTWSITSACKGILFNEISGIYSH